MEHEKYLLASDLDGTLIPPSSFPGDGGVGALRAALEQRPGLLAYVTGRHLRLALEGIEAHALPHPDILVCDVGTSVFFRRRGRYEADPDYRTLMQRALGGVEPDAIRERLAAVDPLTLQEAEKQAEFKVSYYAPVGPEGTAVARQVMELLATSGGAVNVVYSVDTVEGVGLLDVLPAGVAKDTALRYLHDHSGVAEDRLVYAGDSGNDRAAMLTGFNVVVVGNASEVFKEEIRREAAQLLISHKVFVADDSYALGVLQGCREFGIL